MKIGETATLAATLVSGDRGFEHGDAVDCFRMISDFWSVYLGIEVTSSQVCQMMNLLKVARSAQNPKKEDNYVDSAGYVDLACYLETEE